MKYYCIENKCKNLVAKKGNRYRKCFGKYLSKKIKGINNPNYKGDKAKKNQKYYCIYCGKEIGLHTWYKGNKRCTSCSNRIRGKFSNDTKNKISKKKKLNWKDKNSVYNSSEFRKKHSLSISGNKNPNFKEGKTLIKKQCKNCGKNLSKLAFYSGYENCSSCAAGGTGIPGELSEYGIEFNHELKEKVRKRDKYKCQICQCSQKENKKRLDVHHIDYNKKNNDINNLISLCASCHSKINRKREYWRKILSKKKKDTIKLF